MTYGSPMRGFPLGASLVGASSANTGFQPKPVIFDPTIFDASCDMWIRADRNVTYDASNENTISQFQNTGGSYGTATFVRSSASLNPALYIPNVLNGYPGIKLAQTRYASSFFSSSGNIPGCMYFVGVASRTGTQQYLVNYGALAGSNNRYIWMTSAGVITTGMFGADLTTGVTVGTQTRFIIIMSHTASGNRTRANGSLVFNSVTTMNTTIAVPLGFGAGTATDSNYANYELVEFGSFANVSFTDAQTLSLHNQLAAQYNM